MRPQGRWPGLLVLIPCSFFVMVLVHEAGHAFAISVIGRTDAKVLIWPGYELYPDIGEKFTGKWPDKSLAITQVVPSLSRDPLAGFAFSPVQQNVDARKEQGVIQLMGTVATTLTALLSLLCMTLFRPLGWVRRIMAALALFHLDALTYTVFPIFFAAPHFLVMGGSVAEPVAALESLGLPDGASVVLVLSLSAVQLIWLYFLPRAGERGSGMGD